nr:CotD family spore coat protein [Peribacillus glennii]
MPAQVSPPQNFVNTNVFPHVVPHVHPSHTTNVNKHVFTHQHYFPHTQSTVNQCFEQHVVCPGRPPVAPIHHKCCPPRPFGF